MMHVSKTGNAIGNPKTNIQAVQKDQQYNHRSRYTNIHISDSSISSLPLKSKLDRPKLKNAARWGHSCIPRNPTTPSIHACLEPPKAGDSPGPGPAPRLRPRRHRPLPTPTAPLRKLPPRPRKFAHRRRKFPQRRRKLSQRRRELALEEDSPSQSGRSEMHKVRGCAHDGSDRLDPNPSALCLPGSRPLFPDPRRRLAQRGPIKTNVAIDAIVVHPKKLKPVASVSTPSSTPPLKPLTSPPHSASTGRAEPKR